MCRVNSFLGCVKLETFAIVHGWIFLAINAIGAAYYFFMFVEAIFMGAGSHVASNWLALAISLLAIWVCKQSIDAAETRNPEKLLPMKIYKVIECVILIIMSVLVIAVIFGLHSDYEKFIKISKDLPSNALSDYETQQNLRMMLLVYDWTIAEGIFLVIYTVANLYFSICIFSLAEKFSDEKIPTYNQMQSVPKMMVIGEEAKQAIYPTSQLHSAL